MEIINKHRKELIILGVIIEIILVPFIFKNIISLKNKNNDDNSISSINEIRKQKFGIMYRDSYADSYKEYNGSIMDAINAGYVLNIASSKCNDGSGATVEPSSVLSINGSMVTIKSNKTVYCTLYFDYFGTGEKDRPYKIQYIEDLVDIQVAVNSGETKYENKYFELWNNLDFNDPKSYQDYTTKEYGDINGNSTDEELKTELTTEGGWKPIGNTETNSFQGNFDGKNHTISNLNISNNTASASVGLFGVLKNANIKNLKINGTMESSVSANMGSIVGRVYGKSTIENIESNTNITGIQGSGSIGGIIGSTSDNNGETTLTHLINRGTITEGNSTAGIVAWTSGLNATIEDCHNYGEISQTGASSRAGGIVGATSNTSNITVKINNSSNEGNVSAINFAGGIIGMTQQTLFILNSFNSGNVTTSSGNQGGYSDGIGFVWGRTLTIINCYNTGTISGGVKANAGIASTYINASTLRIYNAYNRGTVTGNNANGLEFHSSNATYESLYTYDMPSTGQAFVDTLNNNIDNIDLSSIDSSLSGYTLCRWKLGSSEYPELDC